MCFSDQKRELKFIKFCNVIKLLSKSNVYVNYFYIFVTLLKLFHYIKQKLRKESGKDRNKSAIKKCR